MSKVLSLRPRSNLRQQSAAPDEQDAEVSATEWRHEITFRDTDVLNDGKIEECLAEIHQLSIDSVGSLLGVVKIDQYSWPGLRETDYWYKDLYDLVHAAFGLEGDESLDEAFRRLDVDLNQAQLYLRMLVVAELTESVLMASFPRIPLLSRAWAARAFRSVIKGATREKDEVLQDVLLALRNDNQIKKQIGTNAQAFADDLIETLNPLLLDLKSEEHAKSGCRTKKRTLRKECGSSLEGMYLVAIGLRTEMNLKRSRYVFFWPAVGEDFNRRTMDTEVSGQRQEYNVDAMASNGKVAATLLPGVRRLDLDGAIGSSQVSTAKGKARGDACVTEGKVIVPALVCLKTESGGVFGTHT